MKTEPNDAALASHDCFGLTKREYLAGLAMQGLLANGNHEFMTNIRRISMVSHKDSIDGKSPANVLGEMSLECADALIAALNSEKAE